MRPRRARTSDRLHIHATAIAKSRHTLQLALAASGAPARAARQHLPTRGGRRRPTKVGTQPMPAQVVNHAGYGAKYAAVVQETRCFTAVSTLEVADSRWIYRHSWRLVGLPAWW